MPLFVKGTDLPARLQDEAKRLFVHRHTRDHVPEWALATVRAMEAGRDIKLPPLPVHFASDADWLEHTVFAVVSDGYPRLTPTATLSRAHPCQSSPTWPDTPEYRGIAEGETERTPEAQP